MKGQRPVIRFDGVSKSFSRHTGHMLLREHLMMLLRRGASERFFALRNVSFELAKGESLAVVGHNGAGKSTLLGLVAGLAKPESGTVEVSGRIAALLELGSGFHPDLTGRENVSLNAALLGISRKKAAQCFESIVDFSGIGDFIDEPLRTYSSGMTMRLAFSIAINVDPDILLIDEVLAVGDAAFQAKCFAKVREFRAAGKSLLCVSHANAVIPELCDRAIWLDHGELIMTGDVTSVLASYAGSRAPSISAT
jgi:ABC-type polysaccharide/polyol phosphate transport system ATPase subunit